MNEPHPDRAKPLPLPAQVEPAHPQRRREPLPWQRPKNTEDDPEALRRVQAILDSASYKQADEDISFLRTEETRGLRLQLDYVKPEVMLQAHGVERTVVIFGSARTWEPAAARRWLQRAHAVALAHPQRQVAATSAGNGATPGGQELITRRRANSVA